MRTVCILGLFLLGSFPVASQELSGVELLHSFVTGMTVVGGAGGCPLIVSNIAVGSPAESAGIQTGDVLFAVDGTSVSTHPEVIKTHSNTPKPVRLSLLRQKRSRVVTVGREQYSAILEHQHMKLLELGEFATPDATEMIAPLDATEGEMKSKVQSLAIDRFVDRVFPSHYPANEKLYYPGFEVLILKNPTQVVVLGIENGPASRAGVHWGDTILSVNGLDPRNKSVKELEPVFSSDKPTKMTLTISRQEVTTTFTFKLAETKQVLRDNQKQLLDGTVVPLGLPQRYLSCFR